MFQSHQTTRVGGFYTVLTVSIDFGFTVIIYYNIIQIFRMLIYCISLSGNKSCEFIAVLPFKIIKTVLIFGYRADPN